jgi:hypothetical protein
MVPDYIQPLEAWRKFTVADRGRVLASVAIGGGWTQADPGPAFCAGESHDEPTPHLACSCGYYAYKTREMAEQHGQGHILARCEVWGRIAEHTNGYRAERICLKEIFMLDGGLDIGGYWQGCADSLRKRYQIPVTILKGQTSWTSENPNVLSSWSLSSSLSGFQPIQIGQAVSIPRLLSMSPSPPLTFHPQAFALATASLPITLGSSGFGGNYTALAGSGSAITLSGMMNASSWYTGTETLTKAPKRQYFDFTDMDV